jgi:hypothetical protein
MDTATILTLLAIFLLSLALPVGIMVSRNNVKSRRQEIIADMEEFLRPPPGSRTERAWQILPSFEFVKVKYFMGGKGQEREREFSIRLFSVPVLVFVLVSALGFTGAFLVTTGCFTANAEGRQTACPMFPGGIPASVFLAGGVSGGVPGGYLEAALTVASFAFLGSYAQSMRTLLRAVSNFDLSPLTFFRQSVTIFGAIFIVVTAWRTAPMNVLGTTPGVEGFAGQFQPWYAAAFVMGLVPGLAERHLVSLWRRGLLKEVDRRAIEASKTVPLEIIDGIDADIRARLEEFNLFDVQNLATANHIMMFV